MAKTRVLIVDDSALIRQLLTAIINRQSDMTAVGAAPDPLVAREMIRSLNPDVITLDVEMPKMDGLDFLEKLMRLRPMPVVMVSTLTEKGADVTLRALDLGAVDFVAKPKLGISEGIEQSASEILEKIRVAAKATVRRAHVVVPGAEPAPPRPHGNALASTEKVILIGASTGGTEAIRMLLMNMPPDSPGILVTQHMPAGFTKSFADRLNECCSLAVSEAKDGERVLPGHAYIAPGSHHLLLARSGANYVCRLSDADPVNRHRPSVEVLFKSGAAHAGANAIGVMLTGMGKDGAVGMKELRDSGSWNLAQDEASCVVFGMPKEAIAVGAVHEVLPLDHMAPRISQQLARIGAGNRV
ncbi:chemotaxis response regulator protein-glutamate methylesterase [Betaproteobacteria bacterium GR16-43]|nr:chemotaxis response regulator protein-glutamate methylesterase [Betaproteobacteria bacterium GR16-43]